MELMRKVMGGGGEVSSLSDHPALAEVAAVRPMQTGRAPPAESKVAGRMTWAAAAGWPRLGPEGERRPRRLGGWRDRGPAPSEPARCPPAPGGAAGSWRPASGARPLLGRDKDGPAPVSAPLGPESGPPCRPRRLTALRAPQPQTRPCRSRGAQPGSRWRTGDSRGASLGLPLGGTAARCAWLRSAGTLATERSTARPGTGREAARSGRPKAGAGWRRVPSAPRPFPESPRGLRGPPYLPPQPGGRSPPSLECVEGWVWGRGRVWGRTRRRGCLCGRTQLGFPQSLSCLSSSLLLLRAEPGMGGPASGRPGTVM